MSSDKVIVIVGRTKEDRDSRVDKLSSDLHDAGLLVESVVNITAVKAEVRYR